MAFHLTMCSFYFGAVLIVGVSCPFGVKGRMWNLIVSLPFYLPLSKFGTPFRKFGIHPYVYDFKYNKSGHTFLASYNIYYIHVRDYSLDGRKSTRPKLSDNRFIILFSFLFFYFLIDKVEKKAMIRNRYNRIPHPAQAGRGHLQLRRH